MTADPAGAADIEIRDLTVRYGASAPVFSGVAAAIRAGEAVALIGANGAGKSTLLKACLGFIRPEAGDILVFGRRIGRIGPRERRQVLAGVGFVAQKHNLVLRLSVLSNVIHGALAQHPGPRNWLQGFAAPQLRRRALDALDRVGLADLALRRADSLSGGQQQRIAIARSLVGEPRLILADEPAASLDPAAGEEVMQLFSRISREVGATLVFTTHNLDHAQAHAGRILGLRGGRLALDSPAAAIEPGGLRGLYD